MNPCARYFVLIPAAGVGARMAAACPKQYLPVAGKSILQRSVSAFLNHDRMHHVFVVVSPDDAYVATALEPDPRLSVLYCGGASRADSVLNGLMAMHSACDPHDWVLVHDAARPGINSRLISRLLEQTGDDPAGGLLAVPVADTVKLRTQDEGKATVTTLPRTGLWLAQTPQMFRYEKLVHAMQGARQRDLDITDEAGAMEAAGWTPVLVEGHWCNTKITRPDDLTLVETCFTDSILTNNE